MEENEALLIRIESKIRMLGDQLMAKNAEIVTLHEEIKSLRDKINDQEAHGAQQDTEAPANHGQIEAIKHELAEYIEEMRTCIELVNKL